MERMGKYWNDGVFQSVEDFVITHEGLIKCRYKLILKLIGCTSVLETLHARAYPNFSYSNFCT